METARPPQKLYTKKYGELEVVRSWNEPPNHIAQLSNGAFVHITGVPIEDKAALRRTIHDLGELQMALDWFDHRHDKQEDAPMKVLTDGADFFFEDGSPITNISQLTQAMKPGAVLDAALSWFTRKQDADKQAAGQKTAPDKPPVKAKPKGAARKKAIQAKKTAPQPQAVTA